MAECIRTRKRFSTPLEDLLWGKRLDEENRSIRAEEEARIHRETRDGIDLDSYEFKRDDTETYLNLDGSPSRLAMLVKHRVTGRKALVVCEVVDGKPFWSVMGVVAEHAPNFIQVMQARLAFNRRERLSQGQTA